MNAGALPLLARVFRGAQVESVHHGYVAVVRADGSTVLSLGDVDTITYLRSAAKPFQAIPLVEDGIPEAFGLSEPELALVCASHNGEPRHVAAARSILQKAGFSDRDLLCGIHRPLGVDLGVVEEKPPYSVLQNNCSGKHAGMLAACRHRGWSTADYLEPDHPHQRRILEVIACYSGVPAERIGVEVDGCSVPVFALPIRNMARMYARLAEDEPACGRIFEVMWRHADMVGGRRRFDTEMMQALRGRLVAKTGAEGLQCFAVRHPEPFGIAIKIADGNRRAVAPVALKLLTFLGVLGEAELRSLQEWVSPVLRNHRGIRVGRIDCPIEFSKL